MYIGNIASSKLLPNSSFSKSRMGGLGDIWSDLMSTATSYETAQSQASIAQSQAAQAQAQAQAAAAQAATVAAANKAKLSTTTMYVLGGVVAVGLFMFMRRRSH